jgi:hypothetical protein
MEVPLNRSWGILLLDRVCLAMIVVAVTGILYILAHA